MTMCVSLFLFIGGRLSTIPLAYCTLDSLDIFNPILMVLRPYLTGVLFDLILKFRAALFCLFTTSFSLLVLFFCLPLFLYIISAACVHFCTNVCECKLMRECVSMCVCSWMTGQGLWTLRPGWRIERPLEALWKPLQPALTPSGGRGAREGRSKPERRGQEVDVKRKIRGASTVQGSICGLCRISKRVSVVSKKGIKTRKSMLLWNAGYSKKKNGLKHRPEGLCQAQWHPIPVMLWRISCSKCFQMPVEFLNSELWVFLNNTAAWLLNDFTCT